MGWFSKGTQPPSAGDLVTVYVELLDEGARCVRPTQAEPRSDGSYLLKPTSNYDPDDERWEILPGNIVRCRTEAWSGAEILVAREIVAKG